MESVFHFICGSTGSVVCFDCFAFVDPFLYRDTWGWILLMVCVALLGAVFDVGVLVIHNFLKVVGIVVKACGHWICGNWTYPIAFACILPSMIGPVMLVTSKNGWECFIINV